MGHLLKKHAWFKGEAVRQAKSGSDLSLSTRIRPAVVGYKRRIDPKLKGNLKPVLNHDIWPETTENFTNKDEKRSS